MGKDVKYPKRNHFLWWNKNFNEEKVISLFSSFVKVHVFIITMRQGAELKKFL